MANPTKMRVQVIKLAEGAQVQVYSNRDRLVLQLRRQVATEVDLLAPSFKVAVELTPAEALNLAAELLHAAAAQLPPATQPSSGRPQA